MKPYKGKVDKKILLIFFDCECTENTSYENKETEFLHIVDLIVAQQVYHNFYKNLYIQEKCDICGDREHILEYNTGTNVVKSFIDYCLKPRTFFFQHFLHCA